jgi:hypothetical protein
MAPRTLISKFAGTCQRCRTAFLAGTAILWARNAGATHADPQACAAAAAQPVAPSPPAVVVNLRPIYEFLVGAQARGLQWPKARFLAPDGKQELRLTLAGTRSKVPGSIQVYLADAWIGRVEPPEGRVVGSLASNRAVLDLLVRIASNPAEAAQAYGALMGRCSFCGLALTDEGSVDVGYGPVCAKKWGLPHQPKGTRGVQAVA